MNHLLFVTAAVLLVAAPAGCSRPGARGLIGQWKLSLPDELRGGSGGNSRLDAPTENDSASSDRNDDTIADNTSSLLDGVAEGETAGEMTLIFHRNGSLETITDFPAARSHKHWRWSMVSWDAVKRVAVVRCEMDPESVTTTIRFIDPETIQLVPPNIAVLETELQFTRQ